MFCETCIYIGISLNILNISIFIINLKLLYILSNRKSFKVLLSLQYYQFSILLLLHAYQRLEINRICSLLVKAFHRIRIIFLMALSYGHIIY